MPQREYFYRDNTGKIRKFAYCCLCGAGPFKRSQKDFEYFTISSRSETAYCLKCSKNLNVTMEDIWDKSSLVAEEKVEVVNSKELKYYPKKKELSDTEYNKIEQEDKKEIIRYDEMYEEKESDIISKKEEEPDRTGAFYVYIGQYCDDSYRVDVTENIEEEINKINSGTNRNFKKLPMELLYYHVVTSWKQALFDKDQILHMNGNQKEELIEKFIESVFEK